MSLSLYVWVCEDGQEALPGAEAGPGSLLRIVDSATSTSDSMFLELSPPAPPPSFFKLASTASSLSICSRTATPVVPGWTFEYVVENDTGRAYPRKSVERLKGATLCGFCLEKLSRAAGVGSGMVLMDA